MPLYRVMFLLLEMYFTKGFVMRLEDLVETEKMLVEEIEEYIKGQSYVLTYIKWQYKKFKAIYEKLPGREEYKNNPIIAYQLIRRLFSDWQKILCFMGECDSDCDMDLPSEKDIAGAAWGVVRLQDVYLLSASDIANGNIPSIPYSTPMTADDCYTIAKQCYINENYVYASEWLAETLFQLHNNFENVYIDKEEVLEQLVLAFSLSGDTEKAVYYFKVMPKHKKNSQIWYKLFGKLLTNDCSCYKDNTIDPTEFLERHEHIVAKLCRQEFKYSSLINKNLKCYYKNSYVAANIVKFKVEEVSLDPPVLIFHDVISTTEIEHLKLYGRLHMKPARVYSVDGTSQVKQYRTSSNAWVQNNDPVAIRLGQRINAMTGLSMGTAESLQISNYGVGGEYRLHYDMLGDKVKYTGHPEFGDRIATFMFYLSDVNFGGSTVFPFLELSVKPQKGSAVFWYNLMPSGAMDARTMHASCPILHGNKWVANKWIHEVGQEFIRPCPVSL